MRNCGYQQWLIYNFTLSQRLDLNRLWLLPHCNSLSFVRISTWTTNFVHTTLRVGLDDYKYASSIVRCTFRTYSMLLKVLAFALHTSPVSVQALQSGSCLSNVFSLQLERSNLNGRKLGRRQVETCDSYEMLRLGICCRFRLLKLQRLQNKVLLVIGNFQG
jgi:hypothetical protein